MKYLLRFSIDPNKYNEAISKMKKIVPDESGKYPKKLSEAYNFSGQFEGFRIVEATPEQQVNLMVGFAPEIKVQFKAITEFPKVIKTLSEKD